MSDNYEFLKKQHDAMAIKELRRKIAEWAETPEAEAAFKQIAETLNAEEVQMQAARRELYEMMRKPVEI